MRRVAPALLVFVYTFAALAFYARSQPLGSGFLDPVSRIESQDEAVYAHISIRMAERGEWLTPYFLDRFFLYKPPLLYWLSGFTAMITSKPGGVSAFSLRIPSLVAGAFVAVLVFLWVRQSAGTPRAVVSGIFLLLSPLFLNLSGRVMTDSLLTLFLLLALWILNIDPQITRLSNAIAYSVTTTAAILTKSAAGVLPLFVLGLWFLFSSPRPKLLRVILIGVAAFLGAAPWFLYQYVVHPRWFWAEFVQIELLAYGAGAPPQTSPESGALFYSYRLFMLAPLLVCALVPALPRLLRSRSGSSRQVLLPLLAVLLLTVCVAGYQYRNAAYLLPFLPLIAILCGVARPHWTLLAAAPIALVFVPLRPPTPPSSATVGALEHYRALGRPNDLVIVDAEDQFHATTLPLPRVRYAFPGSGQPAEGFALDFRRMGIVVSAANFKQGDLHRAHYRQQMLRWGLPNDRAYASVIAFASSEQLGDLIRSSPGIDFLLHEKFQAYLTSVPHSIVTNSRPVLLLLGPGASH